MTFHRSLCSRKRQRTGSGAFSLLELLIAITLVAIITAIVVPVSGTLRNKARAVECVHRLKQSGAALLMYAADHGNTIRFKAGGNGGAEQIWAYLAAPYVQPNWVSNVPTRAFDTFYCPDYFPFRHDPVNSNWLWDSYGGYFIPSTYAIKENIETESGTWSSLKVNLSGLPSASYPMLLDSVQPELKRQRMSINTYAGTTTTVSVHMRHGGRANAVFYDGHVEALDGPGLKKIGFSRGFDRDLKPVIY